MTNAIARGALLVLTLASQAQAQRDDPPLIPLALAQSIPIMFGEPPHFSVGHPPASWPSRLVPGAPATIVGGMTLGPITTMVLEYPHSGEGRTHAIALATRAGFVKKPGPDMSTGFAAPGNDASDLFCSDSGAALIMLPDTVKTSHKVALIYLSAESHGTSCGPAQGMSGGITSDAIQFPSLHAPPGARVIPSGTSSSSEGTQMTAFVDTTFDASTLLTHYGRQLAMAGWKVGAKPVIGDGIAMLQLSARDTAGVQWWGFISVITAPTSREVVIRMVRPTPRF